MSGKLILIPGRDALWHPGGGENFTVALARAAIQAGFEPHTFSLGPTSDTIETDFGIVHRTRARIPPRSMRSRLFRRLLVGRIEHFLEREPGPHVLHGNGGWADTAVAASQRLRRRGIAAVPVAAAFTTMEHEAHARLRSPLVRRDPAVAVKLAAELAWVRAIGAPVERRAFRSVRALIVNYESVRGMLEDAYGPGLPIRLLPYAAPSAFTEEPVAAGATPEPLRGLDAPDAPLILAIARQEPRKGLEVLIDALARLRDRGIAFRACLVGTGPLYPHLRRMIAARSLGAVVVLAGRVPDVSPYLHEADVFVLPSLEEGSGSVAVLEALQAAVPVIASRIDGLPEDLTDGVDAVLVSPGQADALADGLVAVLGDSRLRASLAANGRALYERRFAAGPMVQAVGALYRELGLEPARELPGRAG